MILRAYARLQTCRRGATAIEYALMLGLGALVIISAVSFMGETTNDSFQSVADAFH